jgi:hypothetical protein
MCQVAKNTQLYRDRPGDMHKGRHYLGTLKGTTPEEVFRSLNELECSFQPQWKTLYWEVQQKSAVVLPPNSAYN